MFTKLVQIPSYLPPAPERRQDVSLIVTLFYWTIAISLCISVVLLMVAGDGGGKN